MRISIRNILFLAAAAALAPIAAAQQTTVRVNVFPGATNFPLFIGMEKGVFARHGLKIELQNTQNSNDQRAGLAEGRFEVAYTAVDNAIAMVELAKKDAIIVTGGDGGMNSFMVRSEIKSFDDIRGKVVAVDAPNTAYALVAKKILKMKGLLEGRDYTVRAVGGTTQRAAAMAGDPAVVAGMITPPYTFTVGERGLKSMGRAFDLLGPYQASGAVVMRAWAAANSDLLERYIAAVIESTRMALDPANRAQGISLLMERLKLERNVAEQTYEALMMPGSGLARDARLDPEGFRRTLSLRAEMEGQWGGTPPPPDKYLDLGYYERALKRLGQSKR